MAYQLREYVDAAGRNRFKSWFEGLDPVVAARVTVALARLGQGNLSNVKSVGSGLHELRLDFGPGYRVNFGWQGRSMILLLGGGSKARQHVDIQRAVETWTDYKRRFREAGLQWH